MDVTRRDMLGFASAAGAVAIADPLLAAGRASPPSGAYAEAIDRIRAFAEADLAGKGLPGMLISLAGPDGFGHSFGVGFADRDRRIRVTPDHLFQIGSISKSLVDLCLFALASRGKLDFGARVQALLPEYPLPPEPITIAQLIEHSSGLPNTIDTPFAAFPTGRLWTGFTPGSRFSYCNLGYALLGKVIERASGMSFAEAMDRLVLKPIGMERARPVILVSDRQRFATGYTRLREDVPWLPKAELAPAVWMDFDNAAGSVAATGPDMVAYLRYIGRIAKGKGAPVMPEAFARRYGEPTILSPDFGKDAHYGNGLATIQVDGRPCYRHTGGMVAFSSAFTVDKATGAGCFASVNVGGAGGYRPREITEYALALLNAAGQGRPPPAARKPSVPPPIEKPERFTGRWVSKDGDLRIGERGGALFVTAGGTERPLRRAKETSFVTDHPGLAPYALTFEGENLSVLRLGDRLYGRGRAPRVEPAPARLAALAGQYYNPGSWDPRQTIFVIGNRVFLDTEPLVEAPDGSWRFADAELVSERVWFERPVSGRPQQLNLSGMRFDRMSV
jgi:CubicO group peptidase (beta-lactamase class C family)